MVAGRMVGTLLPVACWLGVAACSLNFDRYAPGAGAAGSSDASSDGFVDAATGDTATKDSVTADTAALDSAATDSAQESAANPCPPTAGLLFAPAASGPITIDG